jgi:ferrochelatase
MLANPGTPDAPRSKEVARFVREFLSDPRVVDPPRWLWLPLLYLVIVPLRSRRSVAAYKKVWTDEGSPLLVLTLRLTQKLANCRSGRCPRQASTGQMLSLIRGIIQSRYF